MATKKKPTRSTTKKPAHHTSHAKKAPAKPKSAHGKTVYKYRRNPFKARAKGIFAENIIPAAIGAGGAVAIDFAFAKIPLPTAMKVGIVRHPVRAIGAIGLGMLAEKLGMKHETAVALSRGGLTVVLHDMAVDLLRGSGLPLAEVYDPLGYLSDEQVGELAALADAENAALQGVEGLGHVYEHQPYDSAAA